MSWQLLFLLSPGPIIPPAKKPQPCFSLPVFFQLAIVKAEVIVFNYMMEPFYRNWKA
jgi:hypothetical protein